MTETKKANEAAKHQMWELQQMQSVPLDIKIKMSQRRIRDWYEYWGGDVYVSFSGGKDSTVLLHIVRELYPDIPAVFIDTGLEYPEIRKFVKTFDNVTILRPEKTFFQVVAEYGYPVIGKEVAKTLYYARKGSEWAKKRLDGLDKDGSTSEFKKRYVKYKPLVNAPFIISSLCCDVMKKSPAHKYEHQTGRKPIIATMAEESQQRQDAWLKNGCNAFDTERPVSNPLSFWRQQDILQYLKSFDIPYCSVYGDIVNMNNQLTFFEPSEDSEQLITTGCDRTGCMFCMFGITSDKTPNRFQRLRVTHPQLYDYCIGGGEYDENGILKPNKRGLGIGKILDYIRIDY
ncbi:MAG: phosphoadenosine phosphosulfate reductase family protein [Eubacterium sp.]|nr:phosphoadenosine phosphosulfate reductase family protein [Eubacterium sp.]